MNLQIINIKPVISKSGREYWEVMTSEGKMSCFDENLASEISNYKGKIVDANIILSYDKKFKNIKSINGKTEVTHDKSDDHLSPLSYKDKLIVAQVAYKLAIEVCIAAVEKDFEKCNILATQIYKGIFELSKS